MNEERKPLSKAARKYHLKTAGIERCPFCKTDIYEDNEIGIIEYGELDPTEDGNIQQTAQCTKCKRRWMDIFQLTEIHELT